MGKQKKCEKNNQWSSANVDVAGSQKESQKTTTNNNWVSANKHK